MKLRIAIITAFVATFASTSVIADPQPGDIRITDPVELIRLGFDPATDEVWSAPDFDDRQMLQERLDRAASPQAYPDPLVDPIWATVQASDFQFRGQSADYFYSYGTLGLGCWVGSPVRIADAPIELPNDHRVTFMDVWAIDGSSTASVDVALYEVCQNFADPGVRTVVKLSEVSTGAAFDGGNVWLNAHAGPNRWIRSATCSHMVRATFSACTGAGSRLQKVRVLWDYD